LLSQDAAFLATYETVLAQKAKIKQEMKDLLAKVKNVEVLKQVNTVNKMLQELFQSVDDCVLQLEDGREQLADVVKVLISVRDKDAPKPAPIAQGLRHAQEIGDKGGPPKRRR